MGPRSFDQDEMAKHDTERRRYAERDCTLSVRPAERSNQLLSANIHLRRVDNSLRSHPVSASREVNRFLSPSNVRSVGFISLPADGFLMRSIDECTSIASPQRTRNDASTRRKTKKIAIERRKKRATTTLCPNRHVQTRNSHPFPTR